MCIRDSLLRGRGARLPHTAGVGAGGLGPGLGVCLFDGQADLAVGRHVDDFYLDHLPLAEHIGQLLDILVRDLGDMHLSLIHISTTIFAPFCK